MDGNFYLSLEDAAHYLRLTISYTYKLVHRGKITHYKPTNGRLYFLKEDLDAFIRQGKRSADFELGEKADQILNSHPRIRRKVVAQ